MGSVQDVSERAQGGVVGIGKGGRGSGFVLAEGTVVTSAHNLRGEEVTVRFAGGRSAVGTVKGVDPDGDLAVVAVDTQGAAALELGDGEALAIGAEVVALSAPDGGLHANAGHVSATDRRFRSFTGRPVHGAVEHTANLPRGASGGPLTDAQGRVLGVNTHRIGEGFYLARPVTGALRERLDALARGESPRRARLGVALAPPHAAARLRTAVGLEPRDGLLVTDVEDRGPAAAAGIAKGDLLVAAGDRALAAPDDLYLALDDADALTLTVVRGVEERTVRVDLSADPPSEEA